MLQYILVPLALIINNISSPPQKKETEKTLKGPKIEWSQNKKFKGSYLGETSNSYLLFSKFSTWGNMKMRFYDNEHKLVKKKKFKKRTYKGLIIHSDNNFYTAQFYKKKGKIFLGFRTFDPNEGSQGDIIKLMDMKRLRPLERAGLRYDYILSPDNKTCMIVVEYYKRKNKQFIQYVSFDLESGSQICSGDMSFNNKRMNIELMKYYVGDDGRPFLVIGTQKEKGDKYDDPVMTVYKGDTKSKKPVKMDIEKEINNKYSDVIVKTLPEGYFSIVGLAVLNEANLADKLFVLNYSPLGELIESKLPQSEEEEYVAMKLNTPEQRKALAKDDRIWQISQTNNGSYYHYTISDYVVNTDGSSYAVLESGQLVKVTSNSSSWYYFYGGNLEILRLDKELNKEWQKTVYKNNMLHISPLSNKYFDKKGRYTMITNTYTLNHHDNKLDIIFLEKGNCSKNAISKVDTKSDYSVVMVRLGTDGDNRKYNCGSLHQKKGRRPPNNVWMYKDNKLMFITMDVKNTFGVLDLTQ